MGPAKKQHERLLLDRFLEHQGISPTSIRELESPDFLIDLEGRDVGIEVTELFIMSSKSETHPQRIGEPPLQATEHAEDMILSKARKIYFDAESPFVQVEIWFSGRITPDKKKRDQIAKLIADQIQSMSCQNSQTIHWRSSEDENAEHSLSEWVDRIYVCGVPAHSFTRWTVARPGMVAPLTPERLQDVIEKKAKKIGTYKKCAAGIWLLIVADRTRPSQRFFVVPDVPLDSVSSPFTKTFYYDCVHKEVIDLTNTVRTGAMLF